MKILHVIPSVSPHMGGPTQAVLNLVKALREIGVDAEIATTNDNGATLLDVPLNQITEYKQVPICFFSRAKLQMKDFIFSRDLTYWLWKHIRDYDLVATHYLFSYAPTCASAIARLQGIPYITRTIGQLSPWALAQSRQKKQLYSWLIERHNLNNAAAIHCTATGEVEDVRKFGVTAPAFSLPLGVNEASPLPDAKDKLRHIYKIPLETPIVLFFSRLHYKKRPDLLLQSLGSLAKDNNNFHLLIAGSGEAEYENELKNLAASLGITHQVTFTGFVTGEKKNLLLQGSDIFVLPSFSENFGVAVAEAMAAGLPIVISPGVLIAPDVAAYQAGLVIEGTQEKLTEAISQLLKYPQLRQSLGENGKRLVRQQYSWGGIAENLASIYSSVIQKKNLPDTFSIPGDFSHQLS